MTAQSLSQEIDEYAIQHEQKRATLKLPLKEIAERVTKPYDIEPEQLSARKKPQELVKARRLIALIVAMNPSITQREVAELFNQGQNSISMVQNNERYREDLKEEIEKILMF